MIRHSLRRRGGWYFVDFRWNGQRFREALKTSRKDEAASLALAKIEAVVRGSGPAPVTLGEVVVRWLNIAQSEKRSWRCDQMLSRSILEHFGFERPLGEIRAADVQAFKAALAARRSRRGGPLSKATVNRHLALLKSLFNRAADWDLFPYQNPCRKVRLFTESSRQEYFSPDEVRRLLLAARDVQAGATSEIQRYFLPILATAVFTGCRLGEVLGLRWSDVRDGFITVRAEMAKSKRGRQVPLNEALAAMLRALPSAGGEVVFPVRHSPDVIAKVWRRVKRLAGVDPRARFHNLRHTFASLLVQGGADLATVRELLGHSDIKMTALYSHSSRQKKIAAVGGLKFE